MCLWCCWKDLDEQDNGIYLVRFGVQNVGEIEF